MNTVMTILILLSVGLLLLIPSALPISLIYKLSTSCEQKKRNIVRILSISFFIPLTNFLLFIFSILFHSETIATLSGYMGFSWLFIILPISFLIVVVVPKRIFAYKRNTLITIVLTEIIGWILVFLIVIIINTITIKQQKEYHPMINYINHSKKY